MGYDLEMPGEGTVGGGTGGWKELRGHCAAIIMGGTCLNTTEVPAGCHKKNTSILCMFKLYENRYVRAF